MPSVKLTRDQKIALKEIAKIVRKRRKAERKRHEIATMVSLHETIEALLTKKP